MHDAFHTNHVDSIETGRFHAFEIAHNMDRNSTGRGVRQFKTSLLPRLERVRTQIEALI